MKKIIWKGPECTIPGLGRLTKGSEKEMSNSQADSYVAQGLAKEVKPAPTKKQTKVGE